MIKRLFILLCLLAVPAGAQTLLGVSSNVYTAPVVVSGGGGGGGFQGLGDITSNIVVFTSTGRAYNAAYAAATSPIVDLVDIPTGLLACTMKVATTGFADLTTPVCPTSSPLSNVVSWCSLVGGCNIVKVYDQSGTGDHFTPAISGLLAQLSFNAQNGLPCLLGAGTTNVALKTSVNLSMAVPFSVAAVGKRTSNFTASGVLIENGNLANYIRFNITSNVVAFANNTQVTLPASDNVFHAMVGVASASSPLFAVDSSSNQTSATNGTVSMTSSEYIGNRSTGSSSLSGFFCEGVIWSTDQNSNYIAILANQRGSNGWNF